MARLHFRGVDFNVELDDAESPGLEVQEVQFDNIRLLKIVSRHE